MNLMTADCQTILNQVDKGNIHHLRSPSINFKHKAISTLQMLVKIIKFSLVYINSIRTQRRNVKEIKIPFFYLHPFIKTDFMFYRGTDERKSGVKFSNDNQTTAAAP